MMSKKRLQQLKEFYYAYAARFNNALCNESPDINGIIKSFADSFIAANPSGVSCGSNNEAFGSAISQGYQFYKNIGITEMEIVTLQTTILDEFHEMTKIRWKSGYTKKDGSNGSIVFDNFYFTQSRENDPKIFAYITGDEQAALKKHGLV